MQIKNVVQNKWDQIRRFLFFHAPQKTSYSLMINFSCVFNVFFFFGTKIRDHLTNRFWFKLTSHIKLLEQYKSTTETIRLHHSFFDFVCVCCLFAYLKIRKTLEIWKHGSHLYTQQLQIFPSELFISLPCGAAVFFFRFIQTRFSGYRGICGTIIYIYNRIYMSVHKIAYHST